MHPEEQEFTTYPGETGDYGEDGWVIAKKVFEMGGRMAIGQTDSAFGRGRKFEEGKILHCFLNSIGCGATGFSRNGKPVTREAVFNLKQFFGRMLIIRDKNSLDPEIEQEIRWLVNDEIDQWKGKPMEII